LEAKGDYLKQLLQDKLIKHREYIDKNGEDLPEIRNWKWGAPASDKPRPPETAD
jgi:xylulose-5-phosphate/fructose-6-phosphate phosphoketolase